MLFNNEHNHNSFTQHGLPNQIHELKPRDLLPNVDMRNIFRSLRHFRTNADHNS